MRYWPVSPCRCIDQRVTAGLPDVRCRTVRRRNPAATGKTRAELPRHRWRWRVPVLRCGAGRRRPRLGGCGEAGRFAGWVLTSPRGPGVVSLTVDGRALRDPSLETTREGIVVRAIHEEVPDSHTLVVTVTVPQVNLESEPQT